MVEHLSSTDLRSFSFELLTCHSRATNKPNRTIYYYYKLFANWRCVCAVCTLFSFFQIGWQKFSLSLSPSKDSPFSSPTVQFDQQYLTCGTTTLNQSITAIYLHRINFLKKRSNRYTCDWNRSTEQTNRREPQKQWTFVWMLRLQSNLESDLILRW